MPHTDTIVDLHCHIFPAEAAGRAGTSISVTLEGDAYRYVAGSRSMLLEDGLVNLDAQVEDMRQQGVGLRALAPPPFTLNYELPAAEGVRWARAINDGIAEAVAGHPEHFVGFATLPLQDVGASVTELARAIETLGLRGIEIATNINGVELDDPALEPFWEEANGLNVPILVHPWHNVGPSRMGEYYLSNLIGNPVETALAGSRLIFGGVLERYPGLKIILSHGGGALPHLVGRLRHGHKVRDEPKLRAAAPIKHIRRLYYDTVVFDPLMLRHMVETVGAEQVTLGTDYPFDMGEPDPVGFVRGSGLSDADIETILGNGARLLGM
ncbi:MAG TPA: amidohydrolase family protein [Thermomicrobiales bacterium]|nr:amidohydrolase family protein [Thermomicrobiales bacterium]